MAERGAHTQSEIMSQPSVWASTLEAFPQQFEALKALWQKNDFDRVIFSGCGSTYYLSWVGASLFQSLTGILAQAYPASEIALSPDVVFIPNTNTLFITVSRSGETTETLEAVKMFREKTGNPVVTITCYGESQLAKMADVVLLTEAAQEESLAQTRSFSSMLIVVEAIAGLLGGKTDSLNPLVPTVQRLINEYDSLARQLGENKEFERFFFLGSGFVHGIAQEAMLKLKEMSFSYSEAFHMLEFRHGPMSMINEKSLVIGLITEEAHQQEAAVLRQMKDRGAQVLAVAEEDYGLNLAEWTHFVELQSGLPLWVRPVAYLPVLQLLAYYRAMSCGKNPDQPENLVSVIVLDTL
jgi:glutamine---fructose-6-phosphate transaminase (isomerizing)